MRKQSMIVALIAFIYTTIHQSTDARVDQANLPPINVPTGSYSDSEDSYTTYGVHGAEKLSSGGNSACPKEPVSTGDGWYLCCENEFKFVLRPTIPETWDQLCATVIMTPEVWAQCVALHNQAIPYQLTSQVAPKCCGPNVYDPLTEFCCGGVINTATPLSGCCNGVAYLRSQFVCCNSQLFRIDESLYSSGGVYECCGSVPSYSSKAFYNPIQPSPMPNPLPAPLTMDGRKKRSASAYNYSSGSYGQYGQQNQAYYQLQLFDVYTQICCSGKVLNVTETDLYNGRALVSCCGNKIYNRISQVCCGSAIVNRTLSESFQSCCGADLFDPASELCCNNHKKPMTVNGAAQKCCATDSYDPKSQKCCAGYIVNVTNGEYNTTIKCCSINTYDATAKICCSGLPVNMIPNVLIANQRCCGFDPYDKSRYACCNQENIVPRGQKCFYY